MMPVNRRHVVVGPERGAQLTGSTPKLTELTLAGRTGLTVTTGAVGVDGAVGATVFVPLQALTESRAITNPARIALRI
jgi:hypothetical protein